MLQLCSEQTEIKIAEVEKKTFCSLFEIKLEEGNKLRPPYTQSVTYVLTLWFSELKERTDVFSYWRTAVCKNRVLINSCVSLEWALK